MVVDVLLREQRGTANAEAFFRQAIERSGVIPSEVVTDHRQPYVRVVANRRALTVICGTAGLTGSRLAA